MKFYLLSPNSVPVNPHLFPMFVDAWRSDGIEIVDTIEESDIVLIDLHSRIADYNERVIDFICSSRTPIVTFDEYDKGGMSNLDWPYPLTEQQERLFDHIHNEDIASIHFCRLLNKNNLFGYPTNVFPFEKPILYQEPIVSADALFDRPYDIVWIANTAPQRGRLKNILTLRANLKCKITLGAEKMPLQNWIDAHKEGKMFVSWSAGGYGDEKIQHLFSIAVIIKENNDQLFLHDFTHLENCIRPNPNPTSKDIDTIVEVANNKDRLYELYMNGYNFVKKYYSKEYIANDILEKIKKHLA